MWWKSASANYNAFKYPKVGTENMQENLNLGTGQEDGRKVQVTVDRVQQLSSTSNVYENHPAAMPRRPRTVRAAI
ncbi:unnamed protein product [Onchocerca flexuosa]|uniref:Uncharacterized protein n=1 Tax=Onchocerca flexuosa TaxID=387005 RepID=A0A183I2A2_9BILA|nr:unnamed protein product [Onchocerca flexuosa]